MQFKNTTEWIILIPAMILMILGVVFMIIGYNNDNNWGAIIIGGFFSFCGFCIVFIAENYLKNHKRCPQCAEIVKSEALKCRYCGFDF